MDPRFVGYYERELKHIREMGGEFARQFPKIAGRLGLDAFNCADPYVERLIEAFSYLAARVQMKLGSAHGEFTQHMLELLYPGYLAPTPSMGIMQLAPNPREGSLTDGVLVPRGSILRSAVGEQQTACDYRTAHDVTLWPFELQSADYRNHCGELADMERIGLRGRGAQSALRIRLRATRGAAFNQLSLDRLPLFLRGGGEVAPRLYEQLLCRNIGMLVQSSEHPRTFMRLVPRPVVRPVGFDAAQALLPGGDRSFDGYRLLHEFFAFPERYSFVELEGLREPLALAQASEVELVLFFDQAGPGLDGAVTGAHFALFCTPAINLFPFTSDRVALDARDHEHHLVPDRMRPLDFEVHSITRVHGYGAHGERACEFLPMYAPESRNPKDAPNCYTVRRERHALKPKLWERQQDPRFPYVPSEVFIALVDGEHGAFRSSLRNLSVSALCTNRALPLMLGLSGEEAEFTEQSGAPIASVRCIVGPTPPRSSPVFGETAWGLISHLSLDYLSLLRADGGGAPLRQLLGLYADIAGRAVHSQIDGLLDIEARSVVRPLPFPGPVTFGRGMEVTLLCDEEAFAGTGVFLLGAVLERFFAKYASINSFTETVLRTQQRGEVMRWAISAGRRSIL